MKAGRNVRNVQFAAGASRMVSRFERIDVLKVEAPTFR